jgi:hypothetical protein
MDHGILGRTAGGLVSIALFVLVVSFSDRASAQSGAAAEPTTRPAHRVDPMPIARTETIVILRHGEKPADGLGQLTPQGFNRALALCEVLPKKFGNPDYLFVPDPREKTRDHAGLFNYVRPLATIEPLAISRGLPVQTPCGFRDIEELNQELFRPDYQGATIFVVWEHVYAYKAALALLQQCHADLTKFPSEWAGGDYDSLYVIRIRHQIGHVPQATFALDHEGLDGLSTTMPVAAPK